MERLGVGLIGPQGHVVDANLLQQACAGGARPLGGDPQLDPSLAVGRVHQQALTGLRVFELDPSSFRKVQLAGVVHGDRHNLMLQGQAAEITERWRRRRPA